MNSDLTVLVKRRKCVCFVGVGKVNVRERVKNIGLEKNGQLLEKNRKRKSGR